MRHLLQFFVLAILIIPTVSAQKLLDRLDNTYIDVIVGDNTITEFISSGDNCGEAIASVYRNDSLISKRYMGSDIDFHYEIVNDSWYVMSRLVIDDVMMPNGYNIYFLTEDNMIESFTDNNFIEEEALLTDISDFTVRNDTIYFLDNQKDSIVVVDLKGDKIKAYPSPKDASKIIFYNHQFTIVSNDSINVYSQDMKPLYAIPNEENFKDYRLINNTLYLESDLNISTLINNELDTIVTLTEFIDFKIEDDTLYYITDDETNINNILYRQSLVTGDTSVVDKIKSPLHVTSFAKGKPNELVFGFYKTPSLRPIGVRGNLSELKHYGLQASIEIIEVHHLEATPENQAKTMVDFVVTNYSFADIKNFVYQTDTYGGINCSAALYAEEIQTNISSLNSDTIRRDFNFNNINEEFCINLLSINGRYNFFDEDNRDCKFITAIDKVESKKDLLIYPNPASNEIHFINVKDIESISLYDVNGNFLNKTRINTLDIKDLAPGVYNVKVKTTSGELITRRFMKI